MSEWNIGGLQLRHNEDGTFFVYQPAVNRLLSPELAAKVAYIILEAVGDDVGEVVEVAAAQSTVGGGVISTSDGPVEKTPVDFLDPQVVAAMDGEIAAQLAELTDTELEHDKNVGDARATLAQMTADAHADGSDEAVVDFVDTRPPRPAPAKRRPGRPRKTS